MDALLLEQPMVSGSTIVTPLRKHSGAVPLQVRLKCSCDWILQFRLNVLVMVHLQIMSDAFYIVCKYHQLLDFIMDGQICHTKGEIHCAPDKCR